MGKLDKKVVVITGGTTGEKHRELQIRRRPLDGDDGAALLWPARGSVRCR